jgi:hypothetical protein
LSRWVFVGTGGSSRYDQQLLASRSLLGARVL